MATVAHHHHHQIDFTPDWLTSIVIAICRGGDSARRRGGDRDPHRRASLDVWPPGRAGGGAGVR